MEKNDSLKIKETDMDNLGGLEIKRVNSSTRILSRDLSNSVNSNQSPNTTPQEEISLSPGQNFSGSHGKSIFDSPGESISPDNSLTSSTPQTSSRGIIIDHAISRQSSRSSRFFDSSFLSSKAREEALEKCISSIKIYDLKLDRMDDALFQLRTSLFLPLSKSLDDKSRNFLLFKNEENKKETNEQTNKSIIDVNSSITQQFERGEKQTILKKANEDNKLTKLKNYLEKLYTKVNSSTIASFLNEILSPEKPFLFIITAVMIFITTIQFFFIVFDVFFFSDSSVYENNLALTFFINLLHVFLFDFFNLVDCLLSFFVPFYSPQNGLLVINSKEIFNRHFISYHFWFVDLSCLLPLEYIYLFIVYFISSFNGGRRMFWNLFYYFKFFKCLKLLRFFLYLFEWFSYLENHISTVSFQIRGLQIKISPLFLRVAKYFILLFLTSFFMCAVLFNFLRLESVQNTITLLGEDVFNNKTVFDAALLLFSNVYLFLTSYGGVIPASFLQASIFTLLVLIGIVLNTSIVGVVSSFFRNFYDQNSEKRKVLERMKHFISYNIVNSDLKKKVVNYFFYVTESDRGWDEEGILKSLPIYLRSELAIQINAALIKKVSFFEGASNDFVSSVVLRLIPRIVLPGHYIIEEGQIGYEMFFLTLGVVEVIIGGKAIATLPQGSFFGEIALLKKTQRNASIRASSFCEFYVLTKDDFDDLEKEYPVEFEKIKFEAEKREAEKKKKIKDEKKIIEENSKKLD